MPATCALAEPPARTSGTAALVDLAGQQVVWWAAVAALRLGVEPVAALPALGLVALTARVRGPGVVTLASAGAVIGFLLDTALVRAGALSFPGHPGAQVTTAWMVGLWAAFAIAFSASMAWITRRGTLVALLFGAAAGALAYRAGASLGVLAIGSGGLLPIACGWALAVAALRAVARRTFRPSP